MRGSNRRGTPALHLHFSLEGQFSFDPPHAVSENGASSAQALSPGSISLMSNCLGAEK